MEQYLRQRLTGNQADFCNFEISHSHSMWSEVLILILFGALPTVKSLQKTLITKLSNVEPDQSLYEGLLDNTWYCIA